MNVADDEAIIVRPIVPIHLGLVRADVIRKKNSPSFAFERKSDKPYPCKELTHGQRLSWSVSTQSRRGFHGFAKQLVSDQKAIPSLGEFF
jgi:hypothetical protein